jgi:hypothetical protein
MGKDNEQELSHTDKAAAIRKQDAIITIELLSQDEANRLMKDMQKDDAEAFNGFLISFNDEKKRILDAKGKGRQYNRILWALPSNKRTYYLVKHEGTPYLLVGIKSYDTIASLAKMTSSLSGKAGECLSELLEKELIYKCYAGVFYIDLSADCDPSIHKLLLRLKDNLPKGIDKVFVYNKSASIICKTKSNFVLAEKTA